MTTAPSAQMNATAIKTWYSHQLKCQSGMSVIETTASASNPAATAMPPSASCRRWRNRFQKYSAAPV